MLTGWLRSFTEADLPLVRFIRDELQADLRESDEAPLGIVILRIFSAGTLHQIRVLTQRARVLVLLAPDTQLSLDVKWSLLAAGASDVLDWPGEQQVAECIVSRLTRWNEIESVVMDERVRSCAIGVSAVWQNLLRQAAEIAVFSNAGLLLTGETGTGKEHLRG